LLGYASTMSSPAQADDSLDALARRVARALKSKGWMLATAESCTGGMVAQVFTSIAGSSEWFERGFVTYSNLAKREMLGVSTTTLSRFGAVSEQTARAMAEGALANSHAQVTVAITGIAGPTGGTPEKPVGMVWFGWAAKNRETQTAREQFEGDRDVVRKQAASRALAGLITLIGEDQ